MNVNLNVVKFLKQYDTDPELRKRVEDAEAAYPGSLEIRESVVEDVLIPIAEEMGLGFTLMDLYNYERAQARAQQGCGAERGGACSFRGGAQLLAGR